MIKAQIVYSRDMTYRTWQIKKNDLPKAWFFYLRQGGYKISSVYLFVCLSVCLSVCGRDYVKTNQRISTKFSQLIDIGPSANPLNF